MTYQSVLHDKSVMPIDLEKYETQFSQLDAIVIKHKYFSQALNRLTQLVETAKRYADPEVAILLGESRSGKSRLLEIIEQQWQPYRTPEKKIIPVLRIKITRKPTVKGVLMQLMHAINAPSVEKRGTETQQILKLIGMLKQCEVRVVMLDEFQHFLSSRGQVNYEVADLFKLIADEAQVNIIFSGLPEARGVIDANEQLAGRCHAALYLPRFDWSVEASRQEFKTVLIGCSRAVAPISTLDFSHDDIAFRWFCATGGLIGLVLKVFREALNIIAIEQRAAILLDDLDHAHSHVIYTASEKQLRPFSHNFNAAQTSEAIALANTVGKQSNDNQSMHFTSKKSAKDKQRERI